MCLKESTLFCICHEMFLFCLCPVRSFLDSVLRPFFGIQNASLCVQKASLSVRTGRVRMKIRIVPFLEPSSLNTHFSGKNTKILDPKQTCRKNRSLETQGIFCPGVFGCRRCDLGHQDPSVPQRRWFSQQGWTASCSCTLFVGWCIKTNHVTFVATNLSLTNS